MSQTILFYIKTPKKSSVWDYYFDNEIQDNIIPVFIMVDKFCIGNHATKIRRICKNINSYTTGRNLESISYTIYGDEVKPLLKADILNDSIAILVRDYDVVFHKREKDKIIDKLNSL